MSIWWVSGASGTVGSAVVRHLLDAQPYATVRCYDCDEHGLWSLEQSMSPQNRARCRYIIGDVRDRQRVERTLEGCCHVIHAAALKHVPLCEYNSEEALKTNCLGTLYVRDAAHVAGCLSAVLVSTDKAVDPVSTMGATKLVAERLWMDAAAWSHCRYQVARFGNILGSRGSVIPLWKQQAAAGEAITITDPRMTRYVITGAEVAQFLVALTLDSCRPGVHTPIMSAVDLLTLAKAVVPDAQVAYTGLRPGEKMHEAIRPGESSEMAPRMSTEDVRNLLP